MDFDRVLGLDLKNSKKYLESKEKIQIPEDIKELIEERKKQEKKKLAIVRFTKRPNKGKRLYSKRYQRRNDN